MVVFYLPGLIYNETIPLSTTPNMHIHKNLRYDTIWGKSRTYASKQKEEEEKLSLMILSLHSLLNPI